MAHYFDVHGDWEERYHNQSRRQDDLWAKYKALQERYKALEEANLKLRFRLDDALDKIDALLKKA